MRGIEISFLLKEMYACGAVLSTFELVEALGELGVNAHISSIYRNPDLESYFHVRPIIAPKGITVAVSPRCEAEWAYVRTEDPRWLQHKSKKIAVSQYIKDWLEKNGEKCYTVIGNGTHERFHNMGIERDIDVLICGNNEENKNIHATIEKAKEMTDGRIVWFGRQTSIVEGVENITSPRIEEIPKLYNRAKIFISMSKSEGWGRPVAESIACGVPEIINLNGGNREVEVVTWENIANQFYETLCQTTQRSVPKPSKKNL